MIGAGQHAWRIDEAGMKKHMKGKRISKALKKEVENEKYMISGWKTHLENR